MFIAEPPDVVRTEDIKGEQALTLENPLEIVDAWAGRKGALLWAVSAEDGSKLAEYELDALPVFDGMATANGRLCLPMKNGRLLCLANKSARVTSIPAWPPITSATTRQTASN